MSSTQTLPAEVTVITNDDKSQEIAIDFTIPAPETPIPPDPTAPSAPPNFKLTEYVVGTGFTGTFDANPASDNVDHYVAHRSLPNDMTSDIDNTEPFWIGKDANDRTFIDNYPQGDSAVMLRYCPAAVNKSNVKGPCSPDAMKTVPQKSQPPVIVNNSPVPTNLRVRGFWDAPTSGPADEIKWDAVKGATQYNVYAYNNLLGSVTTPTYTVKGKQWYPSILYTVTAIVGGMESLPSAPSQSMGWFDPAHGPAWGGRPAVAIKTVNAYSEWNGDGPRNVILWTAPTFSGDQFVIYRDGTELARFVWNTYLIDNNVIAGASHTYQIAHLSAHGTLYEEGPKSASVTVTTVSSKPTTAVGTLLIDRIVPNDTSVKVYIKPFSLQMYGRQAVAPDYRVYVKGHPDKVKYAGGVTGAGYTTGDMSGTGGLACVEFTGLDPSLNNILVAEAVDKFGPLMLMDGGMPPGYMAGMVQSGNGHGDPSNVVQVVAVSADIPVTLKPFSMAGNVLFIDTFRAPMPLVQQSSVPPAIWQKSGPTKPNNKSNPYIKEYKNDKWRMRFYSADAQASRLFFMGLHFMETLFDGGVVGPNPEGDASPPHNNNASDTFEPLVVCDISGGKIAHLHFSCDAHVDARRWIDAGFYPAGEDLLNPALQKLDQSKSEGMTTSGSSFVWQILPDKHAPFLLIGAGNATYKSMTQLTQATWGWPEGRNEGLPWNTPNMMMQGDPSFLDRRNEFDIYTSQTHYQLFENGVLIKEADYPTPLPFTLLQWYLAHHVYHTDNDRGDLLQYNTPEQYWINYRPYSDERHWGSVGIEIVTAFRKV